VGLGAALGVVSGPARDLILASALLSIFLSPALFAVARRMLAFARGEAEG
jgi:predicted Kef-type K+ transport protein